MTKDLIDIIKAQIYGSNDNRFKIMKKISRKFRSFIILLCLLLILVISIMIIGYQKKLKLEDSIQNVFDEMVVNECEGLKQAQNVEILDKSDPGYISMKYSFISDNISSNLFKYFGNASKLSMDTALYIKFYISDDIKDYKSTIIFAYNEYLNKLYIYQGEEDKGNIPLTDLEEYRNYLLHDVIIGSWIEYGDSYYTIDDPGEFEIVDYLLPYDYCGETGNGANQINVSYLKGYLEHFEGKENYITWLENEELTCVQQIIEYDSRYWHGTIYPKIPEKLRENVNGLDAGGTRFVVQKKENGQICGLSDIINMNDEFIEWMKASGKATGNLQKIPANREEGYKNTQLMLQNCPEESVRAALEQCEFYIEPGYLHIRFPYWDYESESPGWVKNGNELWKGWLTMETGDIEEFLKAEKW